MSGNSADSSLRKCPECQEKWMTEGGLDWHLHNVHDYAPDESLETAFEVFGRAE